MALFYIGPGDLAPGAVLWCGLRGYSTTYTGVAATVRRASDSTDLNISILSNGALDTASLITFLQGTTGFVTQLWDQTGSNNHLVQTVAANQPGISMDSTIRKWVLTFNGSQFLSTVGIPSVPGVASFSTMYGAQQLSYNNASSIIGFNGANNANDANIFLAPNPNTITLGGGLTTALQTPVNSSAWHSVDAVSAGASSFIVVDGSTGTGTLSGATFASPVEMGVVTGEGDLVGNVAEAGVWPCAFGSSQALSLNSNQSAFWIAPPANGFTLGTYGYLQYRIADELGDRQALLAYLDDSGLTNPALGFTTYGGYIQDAIFTAIAKWERERFYFNELLIETQLNQPSYPWSTIAGQEYYTDLDWSEPALSSVAKIDKMWVLINANRYSITPRVFQYMADTSVNPSVKGFPTDFSWASQKGRFYPIPDNNYPIGVLGTKRLPALNLTSDQNAWTQDAFDLIRCEAKGAIARDFLHNDSMFQECQRAIYGEPGDMRQRGYLSALKREAMRIKGSGGIRPTHF